MKNFKFYAICFLVFIFIISFYILSLNDMGLSVECISLFIGLFILVIVIGGGILCLFTRNIRKKLDSEMENYKDKKDKNV